MPELYALLASTQPFVAGGIAGCCATTLIQPIDMLKVRLQLAGEGRRVDSIRQSPFQLARSIVKTEGVGALYRGMTAGWLRQVVYGSARLGLFRVTSNALVTRNEGKPLPLWGKILTGMFTGAAASFVGNPADLALVRMQSDSTLPPSQRRNYKGVGDALRRIVRDEGVMGLWRGSTPTVIRAVCLNAAMMSSSDQSKEWLSTIPQLGGPKSISVAVLSASMAGIAAAVASLPADMVKTRLQKAAIDPVTGKLPYSGFMDCARQIAVKEGLGSFYTGFGTYVFRIAPHAFVTLLALDGLNSFFTAKLEHSALGKAHHHHHHHHG